jgi:branched-chain amino acid transport system ATP-binding protein
VGHGEIVALVGANGAGKTTTLRTVSGLLHPARGWIGYSPKKGDPAIDITQLPAEQIVALGISHCPEGRGIFSQLSVQENLRIGAYLRGDKEIQRDLDMVFGMFPILKDRLNQAGGVLSGGEQMMLALGRALMSRPRLLILDEPSLGLAPLAIEIIFNMIETINQQGVTILIVEQNAVMALELSSRAYVIETGQVLLSGASRDLACDPGVRKAFLGGR